MTLKSTFTKQARQRLLNEMAVGEMAILLAADKKRKSADQYFRFVQDRNLYYLTGFSEPNTALVLVKTISQPQGIESLFIRRYSEIEAIWNGEVLDEKAAAKITGIKSIQFIDELFEHISIPASYAGIKTIKINTPDTALDEPKSSAHKLAEKIACTWPSIEVQSLRPTMLKLRSVKTAYEVEQHRKAIDITHQTFLDVLKAAKAGMNEQEIEALIAYGFHRRGSSDVAFETIVGGGENATVLHYGRNNMPIRAGSMVLLDFGATWNHYTADISRCFPISGRFTRRQREVYEAVLAAQLEMIDAVAPGVTHSDLRIKSIEVMGKQLKKLKLIKDEKNAEEISQYYMHNIGHQMGLDVHELHPMDTELKPGNIITIEPGIYIRKEKIGVRIEDDILVTKDGRENLSAAIPKTPKDILAAMKSR